MRRTKRTLTIVAFTLASCSAQIVPASTPTSGPDMLRLYATTPVIPLISHLSERYRDIQPKVVFDVVAGNYEAALAALLAGDIPYFITNHLPLESPLWAAPLAQDGIAVIVHPGTPVTGLSLRQLRDVFQGRTTNWQALKGGDREIRVISREDGSGTRSEFERLVMGERLTTRSAQIAPSSAAMVVTVAANADSIGYVSMSYLDDSVVALAIDGVLPTPQTVYDSTYPLRTTIFIAGLEEPTGQYRDFIAWVQSREGQAVAGEKYAPLLRP